MKVAVFIGERFEGPVDHEIDAGDKLVARLDSSILTCIQAIAPRTG